MKKIYYLWALCPAGCEDDVDDSAGHDHEGHEDEDDVPVHRLCVQLTAGLKLYLNQKSIFI